MKKLTIIASIATILGLILSCSKDEITTDTSNKKQYSLNNLFNKIAPDYQNFTFTGGQFQTIIGEKGTTITFYQNSLKDKNGQIVSSGNIRVVLQEMLTGPDMILANKTTTSGGTLLESGGQIYLKAYIGDEELYVNQDSKPTVNIPTDKPTRMNLFYGNLIPNDSMVGDTSIDWEEDEQDTATINVTQDSISGRTVYSFEISNFAYINCDYFYNQNPRTDVNVVTQSQYVDSNTAVFMYFPSINSVTKFHNFNSSTNSFSLGYSYQVPIGMDAKIIVVSEISGQYYYEIIPVTIVNNHSVNSTPSASSLTAIKTTIEFM